MMMGKRKGFEFQITITCTGTNEMDNMIYPFWWQLISNYCTKFTILQCWCRRKFFCSLFISSCCEQGIDWRGVGTLQYKSMKHIVKIMTLLVAISALWIGLLQTSIIPRSHTWLLPIYFIVSLGCYGLLMVGVGLMQFPTCPQEAILLQQDVAEAKEFLKQKGVDVGGCDWFCTQSSASVFQYKEKT